MPPTTALWPLARHTEAKHRVLRRYLEAWLPIVSHVPGRELWLVDGFAGPGQYIGGANGSPTWMLDVYIGHRQRNEIDNQDIDYFIPAGGFWSDSADRSRQTVRRSLAPANGMTRSGEPPRLFGRDGPHQSA